jgi:hypothetical protein
LEENEHLVDVVENHDCRRPVRPQGVPATSVENPFRSIVSIAARGREDAVDVVLEVVVAPGLGGQHATTVAEGGAVPETEVALVYCEDDGDE